jgi:hypothetical protein
MRAQCCRLFLIRVLAASFKFTSVLSTEQIAKPPAGFSKSHPELTFTQTHLPDEKTARGHEKGWTGSLDKLEAHLSKRRL